MPIAEFETGEPDAIDQYRPDRVAWLELFYDLVFVGLLAATHDQYSPHESLHRSFITSVVVVFLFLVWLLTAFAFSRYPGTPQRMRKPSISWRVVRLVLTVIQMIALMLGTLSLAPQVDGRPPVFGIVSMAVALLALGGMYLAGPRLAGQRDRVASICCYFLWAAAGILLLTLVTKTNHPWGIFIVLVPVVAAIVVIARDRTQPLRVSHLAERFGLLILMVTGSVFLSLAVGLDHTTGPGDAIVYFTTLLFPVAIFVMYFGLASPIRVKNPREAVWIPCQLAFAISVLWTGSILARRAIDPGSAQDFESIRLVGMSLSLDLLLMAALCIVGGRIHRAISYTYLATGLILLAGTIVVYNLSLTWGGIVPTQAIFFTLTALVVTVIAPTGTHRPDAVARAIPDY